MEIVTNFCPISYTFCVNGQLLQHSEWQPLTKFLTGLWLIVCSKLQTVFVETIQTCVETFAGFLFWKMSWFNQKFLFICFSNSLNPFGVIGLLESQLGRRQGTSWTDRREQSHRLIFRIIIWPVKHIFGLWEEVEVPGENPRIHDGNMKTPHRKVRALQPTKNVIWHIKLVN